MKILLAYEWCEVGGVESFMTALWKALRDEGHRCELFFFRRGPMAEQLPEGCVAHFGDLAECMKLVRSEGFEIVHANSSDERVGISAVQRVGARLVITSHGMILPGWNSTTCDAFASCSKWQAEAQAQFTDLPIHILLNGIDLDRFKPSDDAAAVKTGPPVVAWVGRGTDMTHKRIDRLAAIAPMLHRAGLRLWIADPYGPERVERVAPEAVKALLPVADFWGMVPKERLPDFYRQVAASGGCILSTSVREGFGLILAEAQACGCPAIGPDVIGVNEVIDPAHGGVLHPPEIEPEQLAKLVTETLGDTERMKWRREACARFAREQFSLRRMAREYIDVYREALARPRRPSVKRRAQAWLEPLLHWEDYVERRWAAGRSHYEASRRLAEQGEWNLASEAARLSLVTSPTIYVRPGKLAHLLKTLWRPAFLRGDSRAAADGSRAGDDIQRNSSKKG